MPTEEELVAAIVAMAAAELGSTELSDQARLVYADWLMARGDRRGELIALDVRDRATPGGLQNPDQISTLLRLAAELGFPHIPDPCAHILPFEQLGRVDHDYRVEHDGHRYTLARAFLTIDDGAPRENPTLRIPRRWTDEETNVILSIISRAIRTNTPFETLVFPDDMRSHPDHRLGPLPMYHSAEVLEDFDAPWMLRARDHARWYAIYDRMMAGYARTRR